MIPEPYPTPGGATSVVQLKQKGTAPVFDRLMHIWFDSGARGLASGAFHVDNRCPEPALALAAVTGSRSLSGLNETDLPSHA